MPEDRSIRPEALRSLFAKFSEDIESSSEFAEMIRDVFLRVCHALQVSDPADPLAAIITRTVISLAAEGESDPDELYKGALNELRSS